MRYHHYRKSQFQEVWQVLKVDILQTTSTPIESVGLAITGVAALLSGLVLSFRGKSLGPIVAIP